MSLLALLGLFGGLLPLIPKFAGMTGSLASIATGFSGLIGTVFSKVGEWSVELVKYLWSGVAHTVQSAAAVLFVLVAVGAAGYGGYTYRNAEVEGYHQNYLKLFNSKKCTAPKPAAVKSWKVF